MQSFKQFIKDPNSFSAYLIINVNNSLLNQKIKILLRKELSKYNVMVDDDPDALHNVTFSLPYANINQSLLDEIINDFSNAFSKNDDLIELDIASIRLVISKFNNPQILIDVKEDVFFAPLANSSCHNIHNVIKCPCLYVFNFDHITDSVLGFLKMDNVIINKTNAASNTKSTKLIKILEKYLNRTKPDILSCQEELIENGLERYAKL